MIQLKNMSCVFNSFFTLCLIHHSKIKTQIVFAKELYFYLQFVLQRCNVPSVPKEIVYSKITGKGSKELYFYFELLWHNQR